MGAACTKHEGMVHGAEAEELRKGIEAILCEYAVDDAKDDGAADYAEDMTRELRRLLDKTDARDSLAYIEGARSGGG